MIWQENAKIDQKSKFSRKIKGQFFAENTKKMPETEILFEHQTFDRFFSKKSKFSSKMKRKLTKNRIFRRKYFLKMAKN